jgi:tripeptide aminopeptidase
MKIMNTDELHDRVRDRLMKYSMVDTQSSNHSECVPTTKGQLVLAKMLFKELQKIGIVDCSFDQEACIVYAYLPANNEEKKEYDADTSKMYRDEVFQERDPDKGLSELNCNINARPDRKINHNRKLGLIAHMDTAPDAPGAGCKPWELKNYDGKDIVLNKEKNIIMETKMFPELKEYIGQDLVLTDGTTLLGGDDKASIAAIMTYLEILIEEKIKHGPISVAFTPDEEVGGLAKNLNLEKFDSSTAYTLDGDHLGWYMDETFNADAAHLLFHGFSVHTGTAKGKLKNAILFGNEFIGMLPENERPETTEGMEGFYYIHEVSGNAELYTIDMIIRDFDIENFEIRKKYLSYCVDKLNEKYGDGTVEIKFVHQYRSMKNAVEKENWLIDYLKKAILNCGVEPKKEAFRGGTDGSALSNRGLPCPNLSAGYENAHGRFEYVPIQSMMKNVEILLELTKIFSAE